MAGVRDVARRLSLPTLRIEARLHGAGHVFRGDAQVQGLRQAILDQVGLGDEGIETPASTPSGISTSSRGG